MATLIDIIRIVLPVAIAGAIAVFVCGLKGNSSEASSARKHQKKLKFC